MTFMKLHSSLIFLLSAVLLLPCAVTAQETNNAPRPKVGFAIIKTSKVAVDEAFLLPGGSFSKKIDTNFSAFLIKHHDNYLLFDTGLGKKIETQYAQDMPYWMRPFFKFDKPVISARQQLDDAGFKPIQQVIISHSHWDHASGVLDFPEARISVSQDEVGNIAQPSARGAWASQLADTAINWQPLTFQAIAYKGYTQSLDLFKDGSVVLVPMPGHTAGSIGMFVTVDSGKCYFFIGDVAWKVAALQAGAPKFWAASMVVDNERTLTLSSVEKVRDVLKNHPDLTVIPAHDATAHDALGYFPNWVR
jgi:glyoxylase-like metal-dependent hydrolase (beta-lactamase superfamily II)